MEKYTFNNLVRRHCCRNFVTSNHTKEETLHTVDHSIKQLWQEHSPNVFLVMYDEKEDKPVKPRLETR